MPREHEYREGNRAQEDFEEGMKTIFQVPKDAGQEKKKPSKSGPRRNVTFPRFWWRGLNPRNRRSAGLSLDAVLIANG